MPTLKFPDGFLWGAATSSHQVEGGNHNDWIEWEKKNADRLASEARKKFGHLSNWKAIETEATDPKNYISGIACDHWNRYEEDFDLLKNLHCNAYRFSIEWSRIEPEEGKFDELAIEHYRKMLLSLRARGIEPFVTLWHWTNPVWVETDLGGWENRAVGHKFIRFAERVVTEYRDLVKYWAIFNEPNTFVGRGYVNADRPPARKSLLLARKTIKNFNRTHREVYRRIHEIQPDAVVILSHWFAFMRPYKNQFLAKLVIPLLNYFRNGQFFHTIEDACDALGVQFYRVDYIRVIGWGAWGPVSPISLGKWQNDLGWDLEPSALEPILKKLTSFKKPIYITESGLADARDDKRPEFLKQTLSALHAAAQAGAPIKGYFHWSLLDNFEWSEGWWPRFGLVEVDRHTLERRIRPSARIYSEICQNNSLLTK